MAENEINIRESGKLVNSDRSQQSAKMQSVGLHSEIESVLASRIRAMWQGGVVVETWMIKEDGKPMLQELHPKTFLKDSTTKFQFKFSNTWRDSFFKWNNF